MTARYLPPMAIVSLNNVDALLAQAKELEGFAASEASLSEDGRRDRFWRAAAALRLAAYVLADDRGLLAVYCQAIDHERAAP